MNNKFILSLIILLISFITYSQENEEIKFDELDPDYANENGEWVCARFMTNHSHYNTFYLHHFQK